MTRSTDGMHFGEWVLPQPGPGETALHAWVVDNCPYVMVGFLLTYGEVYRLRMFGYDPAGQRDEWAAESNAPFADLLEVLAQEMRRLAGSWGGRLRSVDLRDGDWAALLRDTLAGGIVQVVPAEDEGGNDDAGHSSAA